MENEENTEGEIINKDNKTENRFKDLTQKAKELGETAEREKMGRETAEKERDFYSGFSESVAKTPQAAEFKDEIKAKVLLGYSVEDATVSILHSKGKLAPLAPERETIAGGSATNTITQSSTNKTIGEMTRDEKRAAVLEAQSKGDISLT